MLVSRGVDHHRLFADLRTVVIDEVHAFAAGDRGWHLLAVLERLSRIAGRPREGATRNCLFLALREDDLLLAAGLLLAWSRGFVEPVAAPPEPMHITAQQLLALCLQEGRVGERTWTEWLPLPALTAAARPITAHLARQGYLETDGGMLFIGQEAERRFGYRHFMSLMAVFTAPPEFTVLHGRADIGRVDPALLADRVEGPRLLLLSGRSWRVTWTDWKRRRCFVEPAEGGGRARWLSGGTGGLSYEIARSMRDVLLGTEVPVTLTKRAVGVLAGLRSDALGRVRPGGLVISRSDSDLRWWTWAGCRANATLKATLGELADETQRVDDVSIRLRADLRPATWHAAVTELKDRLCLPEVDEKALAGLKFSDALPPHPGGRHACCPASRPGPRQERAHGAGAVRAVAPEPASIRLEPVVLSDDERRTLENWVKRRTESHDHVTSQGHQPAAGRAEWRRDVPARRPSRLRPPRRASAVPPAVGAGRQPAAP